MIPDATNGRLVGFGADAQIPRCETPTRAPRATHDFAIERTTMSVCTPVTCRRVPARKPWAIVTTIAMMLSGAGNLFVPTVNAQASPVGQGFSLDAGDLRFIYQQILVAQDHAAGGSLLGSGANQVADPQLPRGLRTVDGSFNNLVPVPDQTRFGTADRVFPRLLTPSFRQAEPIPFDPDGPGPEAAGGATSYAQKKGIVIDSQPRLISNLIVDQSASNPAAVAAATNPCGEGGFVCSGSTDPDPDSGALFIPNITPDFGLSAPFNLTFAFFGQFFDHGLDLVTKGGGTVLIPLHPDDPLYVPGSPTNFMVITRGKNQPGPDGIVGDDPATPEDESADDVQEATNTTTPWVDQNQTYTSHPSHQVFLRQYVMNANGRPEPDGKVLDGGFCSPRGTGIPADEICAIGNWAEVKAQAATRLGIRLIDQDVFNVPLLVTDPYGHFKPGPNGFPQLVLPGNVLLEGNPAANDGEGIDIPPAAFRTGHAFLDDIAHNAVPGPGLGPDADNDVSVFGVTLQADGTYDDELLDRHFVTGDGRGNENIALTAIHQVFHAEHNRLVHDIDRLIPLVLTAAEVAAWHTTHAASGWGYGERLFQAARFVTEMEYQHLVFEEFARKVQPLINPFLGGITSIDPAISAEFAHTVYRLGHSMLPEAIARVDANGASDDIRLLHAFLNPVAYTQAEDGSTLSAAEAAGRIIRGTSRQVANELDEFVTSSVRTTLLGLPLDLAAVNIARGRSEGIPSLNEARRQFFHATRDTALEPYANWFEFGLMLKHSESLANFVAAYGTHPSIIGASTIAAKRAAAQALVDANDPFLFAPAATSGLDDVDFWIGGLAERQAVFGGLLGSTFNFVFETQLEELQDGDRFYYLQRTDGLNLKTSLEGNSLAEMARRNTSVGATMDVVFDTADYNIDVTSLTGTAPVDLGDGAFLLTLSDGTKLFFDPEHRGKNIVFNGSSADDRMRADIGDDSMFGNLGHDRMTGGEGNDTMLGGNGDDVLFGDNGDDVLKGGPGNDAMNSGPGFGADLQLGSTGKDFMVGGNDGVEYFGGPDDDFILDGTTRSEAIVGGGGDDWLDGGDGHDGGGFGDEGNVFDLLAGLDPAGGDDVMDGGPGQDGHFGEGGHDIFVMSEGTNKYFGDYGFDWFVQRGWPAPADVELDLAAIPNVQLNFNDLRNMFRFVDGASGWDLDDHLRGSNHVVDAAAEVERRLIPGMELTAAGAAKVSGLTELVVTGFGKSLPFMGGNILLGGRGSDVIEGKAGDDLIDGDTWLNAQLEAQMNDGSVKLVDRMADLVDDVFSDPQRLNPGNIVIRRTIITPAPVPADCGAATPLNCDTAVFRHPRSEYSVIGNANGTVTVRHTPVLNGAGTQLLDGTDTLRNIERLQFTDGVIAAPAPIVPVTVPTVLGQAQANASAALIAAGLTVTVTTANNSTIPVGAVIAQSPLGGESVPLGTTVALVVSLGPAVPNVVGVTQANATTMIVGAGLMVGTVTSATSTTVPAGRVMSQNPAGGVSVTPGTPVNLVVSIGPPPPPGLVLSLTLDSVASGIVTDGSGMNNHGVVEGPVPVAGRVGGALLFDGVNDWITVADSDALDLSTAMTLEAWVNPASLTGWRNVLLKEGGTGMAYELYAQNPDVSRPAAYATLNGAIRGITGTAPMPANTWSHLAVTYDGANMRLYVNGALVRTVARTGVIAATNGPLHIGGNAVWGGEFFAGAIDEVRIYNRALSAQEIAADMGSGATPPPPANSAPVAGTDSLTTVADAPLSFTAASLLANDSDPDGDPISVSSVSASSSGGGTITSPAPQTWTYTPVAGFTGSDSFAYTINDGRGASTVGTVTVTVNAGGTVTPGLVLALGFNEAAGSAVTTDSSGEGNHGTVREAQFVAGRFGNALSFDGVNDWVTVPDSNSLDLSSAMTMDAWVRPTARTGWHTLLLKEAGGQMAYEMYANDAAVSRPAAYFTTPGGAIRGVTGTAALPLNAWSHVAVSYDGNNMRFYVNGALVRTQARTGAILTSNGVLHIGGNEVWGGEFFAGLIDEVRIYSRALTPTEIQADMNTPVTPQP
jgi:hypothetical protein